MAKSKATEAEQKQPKDDGLIIMVKPGCDDIKVHPTQVGPWEKQGWTVKE